MNILNKYFNKIYVITSFPTEERFFNLNEKLKNENLNVEWIIAPKQKYFVNNPWTEEQPNLPGNWSYQSAFESIFLKSKLLKLDNFLILEDDIFFVESYNSKLETIFLEIPNDWQILHLGYHYASTYVNDIYFSKFQNNMKAIGAHAVVYKNDVYDYILDTVENCTIPIDLYLNKFVYPFFKTYTLNEQIFYQSSYRHYELDKFEFYKKYKSAVDLK